MNTNKFTQTVWAYFKQHGRQLPWRPPELTLDKRGYLSAYHILVSEMMLQQTQVARVTTKYKQFITRFPNIEVLASSPLKEVLAEWQGLGYNRRALYLHNAAKALVKCKDPWQAADLTSLKGIGPNTAAAVCVYAYNQPLVFIETNIRSVFIHHFFKDHEKVSDTQLLPLIEKTLDKNNPRQWYWALMDYGTSVKSLHKNPSKRSASYKKQAAFEGSFRQLRAEVLRAILASDKTLTVLKTSFSDKRLNEALKVLEKEGLIAKTDQIYRVT